METMKPRLKIKRNLLFYTDQFNIAWFMYGFNKIPVVEFDRSVILPRSVYD